MKPVNLRHGQTAELAGDNTVVVRGQCTLTHQDYTIPSKISIDGLLAWSNGTYIQDALPDLPKEDREFLISGTSPAGWAELFPPGWDGPNDDDDDNLVPLEDMDDDELEAIANLQGGNELARAEAKEAQKILDNRNEAAGSPAPSSTFATIGKAGQRPKIGSATSYATRAGSEDSCAATGN